MRKKIKQSTIVKKLLKHKSPSESIVVDGQNGQVVV
jgi:hypothetical protein